MYVVIWLVAITLTVIAALNACLIALASIAAEDMRPELDGPQGRQRHAGSGASHMLRLAEM